MYPWERAVAEILRAMNDPGHPDVGALMNPTDPGVLDVFSGDGACLRIYARAAVAEAYGTYDPTEVVAWLNALFLTSGFFSARRLWPTATLRDGALAVSWATLTDDATTLAA